MNYPWKYILVSCAIGLLLGGSAGLIYSRYHRFPFPRKGTEMFLRHMDREVRLTEPQKTQIRSLLEANHTKMVAFHEEIRSATQAAIRKVLTPEQQLRFDAMNAKMDAKWKRRRER